MRPVTFHEDTQVVRERYVGTDEQAGRQFCLDLVAVIGLLMLHEEHTHCSEVPAAGQRYACRNRYWISPAKSTLNNKKIRQASSAIFVVKDTKCNMYGSSVELRRNAALQAWLDGPKAIVGFTNGHDGA